MDNAQIAFASQGIEDLRIAHQVDVNPLTGAAVISVPLPLTPGRAGMGPALTLQYSSSAGNSAYGVGWSLAGVPTIGLTTKHHPNYDGKDGYVWNGTEELVPVLSNDAGVWRPQREEREQYRVSYYRSKVELTYTRFEQWVQKSTGQIHWRSRDRNNVLSVYGLAEESRIADPNDPARVYLWLVEAQYDSQGNAIRYDYVRENTENVTLQQAAEYNRARRGGKCAQRYLKRIRDGNTRPLSAIRLSHQTMPGCSR